MKVNMRYIISSIILCPYLILTWLWRAMTGHKLKPGDEWELVHSSLMIGIGLIFYSIAAIGYVLLKMIAE